MSRLLLRSGWLEKKVIKVKVLGFARDKERNTPILLLEEDGETKRVLPIWIGEYEADAIIRGLNNLPYPRPLTHELIINIIKGLGFELMKVEVTKIVSGTYYANIVLRKDNSIYEIDSRPSDAIALASIVKSPIYVSEEVMDSSSIKLDIEGNREMDVREYLRNVNPEDFGETEL